MAEERLTGRVSRIRVDKGFGFIEASDGREYFFHRSQCDDPLAPFERFQPNDIVTFEPEFGPKGWRSRIVRLGSE